MKNQTGFVATGGAAPPPPPPPPPVPPGLCVECGSCKYSPNSNAELSVIQWSCPTVPGNPPESLTTKYLCPYDGKVDDVVRWELDANTWVERDCVTGQWTFAAPAPDAPDYSGGCPNDFGGITIQLPGCTVYERYIFAFGGERLNVKIRILQNTCYELTPPP